VEVEAVGRRNCYSGLIVMAHGRTKYQSRENRARVRELFHREWDPIGVYPEASDEYDTYADKAYVMLMDQGATASAIAEYLFGIATDYMGLSGTPQLRERCDYVGDLLVTLRPEFGTQ
jgi:hypothetical protein